MSSTVIILGAARSGTKFLRDLLGASASARVVPHDINHVWRHGNESHPSDALPASCYTERIGRFIRERVLDLSGAHADPAGVVVEKTVSNTLRVGFVRAVYPEAKLVHLVRDGRAVVESTMRQWRAKPEWPRLLRKAMTLRGPDLSYALWSAVNMARGRVQGRRGGRVWGPRYEGIEEDLVTLPLLEVCARQWTACVQSTLESLLEAPPELVHTVRYEDLTRNGEALERLTTFLGLPDPERVMDRYRDVLIGDADRKWPAAFDAEERDRLSREISPAMSRLGYAT